MKIRVQISTDIKQCTDQESSRYAFSAVKVIPIAKDQAYVAASDGRVLAVTKANYYEGIVGDVPLIPGDLLPKKKAELVAANAEDACFELEGTRWNAPYDRFAEPTAGRFPDVSRALSKVSADNCIAVMLDADLLARLQKALITSEDRHAITLLIPKHSPEATMAIPVLGDTGIGVLMPCDQDNRAMERAVAGFNKHLAALTGKHATDPVDPGTEDEEDDEEPVSDVDLCEQIPDEELAALDALLAAIA